MEEKVNSGFESFVSSQKELEKVTGEVQSQLGNIKEARSKLGVELPTDNPCQDCETVSVVDEAEESEDYLCQDGDESICTFC